MPLISVCIPTWNSARFIAAAVTSVLQQTVSDYEVVICDNASTDNTAALCASFSDSRIRYVRFDWHVGQGANWNRCLKQASGEFVALLHADDEYLPDFLAARTSALAADADLGMAFGAVEIIDEDGRPIRVDSVADSDFTAEAPEFFPRLLMGCVVNPATVVVRRSCFQVLGGFDEQRLWGVDWEMWLRIATQFGVAYTPRVNSRYREHSASGSATGLAGARRVREDAAVLRGALAWIDREPSLRRYSGIKPLVWRRHAVNALYAASLSCAAGDRRGLAANLWYALRADARLIAKPTLWALAASIIFGPMAYRLRWELPPRS